MQNSSSLTLKLREEFEVIDEQTRNVPLPYISARVAKSSIVKILTFPAWVVIKTSH